MELEMKKKMLELIFVTLLITIIFGIDASAQITSNQSDNFEDGTVQGWSEGNPSPNPPANIADGGPGGSGDNYLQMSQAVVGEPVVDSLCLIRINGKVIIPAPE